MPLFTGPLDFFFLDLPAKHSDQFDARQERMVMFKGSASELLEWQQASETVHKQFCLQKTHSLIRPALTLILTAAAIVVTAAAATAAVAPPPLLFALLVFGLLLLVFGLLVLLAPLLVLLFGLCGGRKSTA